MSMGFASLGAVCVCARAIYDFLLNFMEPTADAQRTHSPSNPSQNPFAAGAVEPEQFVVCRVPSRWCGGGGDGECVCVNVSLSRR